MLSLSIKDGAGFTIGPDIVVTIVRDVRGQEVQVHIAAPTELKISRVDKNTAGLLTDKYNGQTGKRMIPPPPRPRAHIEQPDEMEQTLAAVRAAAR